MNRRFLISSIIASLLCVLAGCSGSGSGSGGADAGSPDTTADLTGEVAGADAEDDVGGPPAALCTRDPSLLDASRNCAREEDCPCGAYCAYGLCKSDCLVDADCAGWCDSFGRCRAQGDTSAAGRVTVPEEGWMQVNPVSIHFYADEAHGVVRVFARQRGLKALRAVASEGLLITCQGELTTECWYGPLVSGQTRRVRIQLAPDAGEGPWTLAIHSASRVQQVTVRRGTTAPVVAPAPGIYKGQIWTERATSTLLSDSPWDLVEPEVDLRGVKLPVELRIYPDGGLLFTDPYGVLAGAGDPPSPWVFRLTGDGRFDMVQDGIDRSRQVYLGGVPVDEQGLPESMETEVSVATHGTLKAAGDGIHGRMFVRLGGLGLMNYPAFAVDERPVLRWGFRVNRAGDLPDGEVPPEPGGAAPWYNDIDDSFFYVLPWADAAQACGPLGWPGDADARTRAEYALCFDHGDMTSVAMTDYTVGTTAAGDLFCGSDGTQERSAFRFFTNSQDSAGLLSDMMLEECLTDLEHGSLPPPPTDGATDLACLGALSGCEATCAGGGATCCTKGNGPRCVDVPLVHQALGSALDGLELSGWPDKLAWTATDPEALRLAHRIVQQWVEVNAFVVRESRQAALPLYTDDTSGLEAALARSLDGWRLVLHPEVIETLMHLPAAILHAPDYRGDVAMDQEEPTQDRSQPIGLPVTMLEGLQAQLTGATQLTRQAWFAGEDPPALLTPLLRNVVVVYPVATLLHAAASREAPPPWEQRWVEAKQAVFESLRALLAQVRFLKEGRNPLGIEDDDLPLYMAPGEHADASEQFSAISTYLIDGWATDAVAQADAAKEDARTAWTALLERKLQTELDGEARAARIEELKRSYGEKIVTLCGLPAGLETEDVLDPEKWPGLSGGSCFMDQTNPACVYDEDEYIQALSVDDVAYELCVIAGLKEQFGDRATISNEFMDDQIDALLGEVEEIYDVKSADYWKALDPGLYEYGYDFVDCFFVSKDDCELAGTMDYNDLDISTNEDLLALVEVREECKARWPNATPVSQVKAQLDSSPLDKPDCYRGSLGELALATRGAAKDIEIARSELQDYTDAYTNAMNVCVLQDTAAAQLGEITGKLGELQGKVDTYMGGVNFVADLGTAIIDTFMLKPGEKKPDGSGGGLAISAIDPLPGWKFASGKILEVGADFMGVGELQGAHGDLVAAYQEKLGDALCFNAADMHLVGADTQGRRIERSMLDLSQAILKVRNGQDEVDRLVREGRRRILEEGNRTHTSLVHDLWEDLWDQETDAYKGALHQYDRAMRLARRTVYLAVRAVEYEWQVCELARAEVLAATDPQIFATVLEDLSKEIGTGTLLSQKPDELHYVLSMKQQLLQLSDLSDAPEGFHTLTDTERLQRLLTSPRFAHFDASGAYLGQLIPFSVMPLGVIGLGDPGTVAMLTGADCAERNWSVNAVIQGEDLVLDEATFIRMELLQRNTFFSQWCGTPCSGEGLLQSSSVRPARNLFKDPVWGTPGDNVGESVRDQSDFARTRIEAYLNVSRDAFSQGDYEQGASTELAGRGLYGEYALFFAAEWLDLDGKGGLRLENVDDILLRFDYVSVAKPW
jgi:hypothetical protein